MQGQWQLGQRYAKGEGVKMSGKKAKALHPGGGEDVFNGYTTYIYIYILDVELGVELALQSGHVHVRCIK